MELWDVLDADRKPLGKTVVRPAYAGSNQDDGFSQNGDLLAPGEYHLVVHVWVRNASGQFLISRRSPEKSFPLQWECTGGSAVAGEDSRTSAVREVQEEVGLPLDPDSGRLIRSDRCERPGMSYFLDVWLFEAEADPTQLVCQPGEVCAVRWAFPEEILQMIEGGSFVPVFSYIDDVFTAV